MELRKGRVPENRLVRTVFVGSLLVAGAMGCASTQKETKAGRPEDSRNVVTTNSRSALVTTSERSELRVKSESHPLSVESTSHPVTSTSRSYPLTATYSYSPGPVHTNNPEVDASKGSGRCGKHTNVERRQVKEGDWVEGLGTLLRADDEMIAFECFPSVDGYGTVDLREHAGIPYTVQFEKGEKPGTIYVTTTKPSQ
jgi:hypothetical protein